MNAGRELALMRKPKKLSCAVCDTAFEAVGAKARYCSNKCRQAAAYRRRTKNATEINCKRCGVPILTEDRRIKYCSEGCKLVRRVFQ